MTRPTRASGCSRRRIARSPECPSAPASLGRGLGLGLLVGALAAACGRGEREVVYLQAPATSGTSTSGQSTSAADTNGSGGSGTPDNGSGQASNVGDPATTTTGTAGSSSPAGTSGTAPGDAAGGSVTPPTSGSTGGTEPADGDPNAEEQPGAGDGTTGEGTPDDPENTDPVEEVDRIPLGPTPADGVANFPFPQNRALPNCGMPSDISNDDVMAAYEAWRAATVTTSGAGDNAYRIKRTPSDPMIANETDDTVSEGIAYGMLIAVYMNDQDLFDGLWRYEQRWLDEQGLMHWHINASGTMVVGQGAASDADEDMAWAMIMADRQWGGGGSLGSSYMDIARDLIDKMWRHEVLDGRLFLPGDQFGDWNTINISYFTPNYFRLFAEVSGNSGWNDVVTMSYDALEAALRPEFGNQDNGLVPAWSGADGTPNGGAWGMGRTAPTHHQYDSCRTPFRIGLDYCFNAEPRSKSYVDKITGFYASIGVDQMTDGYDLNGQPRPQFGGLSAAFVGPAAVGAMSDPMHQAFLDDAYARLAGEALLAGGEYYDRSWTVIALLMLTGNFLDYTKIEPL